MGDLERFRSWKMALLEYLRTVPRAAHPQILEALDKRDESNSHVEQLLNLFCNVFLDADSRHPTEDRNRFWNFDGRIFARWAIEDFRSESRSNELDGAKE